MVGERALQRLGSFTCGVGKPLGKVRVETGANTSRGGHARGEPSRAPHCGQPAQRQHCCWSLRGMIPLHAFLSATLHQQHSVGLLAMGFFLKLCRNRDIE